MTLNDDHLQLPELNLRSYAEMLEKLAIEKKEVVFFNSSAEHASLVLQTIFRHAENEIKIFAGNFNSDFCSQEAFLNSFQEFLKKDNTKLKVLLCDLDNGKVPNNKVVSMVMRYQSRFPERVNIKHSLVKVYEKNDTVTSQSDTRKKVHFTLADGRMYRVENDTINHIAKGSFNDPSQTEEMNKVFDTIFESSTYSENLSY